MEEGRWIIFCVQCVSSCSWILMFPNSKNTSYLSKNQLFISIISIHYFHIPFNSSSSFYFLLSINNTNIIPPSFYVNFVSSFSPWYHNESTWIILYFIHPLSSYPSHFHSFKSVNFTPITHQINIIIFFFENKNRKKKFKIWSNPRVPFFPANNKSKNTTDAQHRQKHSPSAARTFDNTDHNNQAKGAHHPGKALLYSRRAGKACGDNAGDDLESGIGGCKRHTRLCGEQGGDHKAGCWLYKLMSEVKFFPNSPTFTGGGTPLGQLAACFVLAIDDDMGKDSEEGIFSTVRTASFIPANRRGRGVQF